MPVNRAAQRAYEILTKRGLYPFEYRITISPQEAGPKPLHTVRIETADGGRLVEMLGVPFADIENCCQPGVHDFDRVVDALLTELLAKVRSGRGKVPATRNGAPAARSNIVRGRRRCKPVAER
jgi:hypothetical protein